jgi:hypothetical protein
MKLLRPNEECAVTLESRTSIRGGKGEYILE